MKLSIAAITLLLAAGICSYALAQKDTGRPVGIPASQWIPLTDQAGIVISDYQPGDEIETSQGLIQPRRVQGLPPPSSETSARGYVDGYFMVKRNGRWVRLSVVPPPQLLSSSKPK